MDIKNINLNRFLDLIKIYKASKFQFDPFLLNEDSELVDYYKLGNKIKIKKENRGKFTESANRSGMGVQEFASHVLSNKDKYSTTQVKRANFARNASKWKHKG